MNKDRMEEWFEDKPEEDEFSELLEDEELMFENFFELSEAEQYDFIEELCERWEYELVIDLITSIEEEELSDDLLGLLAVAYNNEEAYTEAIEVLERIAEENRDARWHYRYGYACTLYFDESKDEDRSLYREKALQSLEAALAKSEESGEDELRDWCIELASQYLLEGKETFEEVYERLNEALVDFNVKKEGERVYRKITVEEVKNLEDIWEINEPMYWTINIYDSYRDYLDSAKPFTEEQRYLHAVMWYFLEVNNGGHDQFFYNSTGIVWKDAMAGFRLFGMDELAENFQKIVDYMDGDIPLEREERFERFQTVYEEESYEEILEEVDDVIFGYDGDHMERYVISHPEKFVFDGYYNRRG